MTALGTTGKQIPFISLLGQNLSFFKRYLGLRMYWYFILSVCASIFEGFGIFIFYPLLLSLSTSAPEANPLFKRFAAATHSVGIEATVPGLLLLISIVFLLKGVVAYFNSMYQYRGGTAIVEAIRRQILDRLAAADYRYTLRRDSGYLTNLVTVEVTNTYWAFLYLVRLFPHIVTAVLFLTVLIAINWRLNLIVTLLGLGILFVFNFINVRMQAHSRNLSNRNADFTSKLIEAVQSFKYLHATNSYRRLDGALTGLIRKCSALERQLGAISSIIPAFAEPIVVTSLAVILFFQVVIVRQSLAAALVSIIFLQRIITSIVQFQQFWQVFSYYTGSWHTVSGAIAEIEAAREVMGGRDYQGFHDALRFTGVSCSVGGAAILRGVTLTIPKNSMIAIVGESGAGKTTLVNLLTGILKPDGGAIEIDGVDLREYNLNQIRDRIGYVIQESVVFNESIAYNISLGGCDPADEQCRLQIRRAAERSLCQGFIQRLAEGYDTVVGEKGATLSGGQRQRLAIARELFKGPEILILDEATSSLDSESERYIQQCLEELKGTMTVVIVSHRLSMIRQCDRVYVLDGGAIAEQGSVEELRNAEGSRFNAMCQRQQL